ncbi:MAG: winged helix-turn-helix domain-containing protein [Candidatus Odinarchaeota archaeon]
MTIIEKFKALSCEARYNIYNLLRRRQMSIDEISNLINLKPITVRHHISELERSGLICKKLNRVSLVGRPSTVYGVNSDLLETSLITRNYTS